MGSEQTMTTNSINRSIVWLDASVNDTQEYINTQQLFHTPTNHLKIFTDHKQCEDYIRSVSKTHRIILIVGGSIGRLIVPRIHSLLQISLIFVYCMDKRNELWAKTYKKVKGVIEELNDLVLQVLEAQEKQTNRERFEQPLSINIYNTVSDNREQSTSELNGQFVHSQILIDCLLRMKSTSTSRDEFISYCKKEYATDNHQLNIIREFQHDYSVNSTLKWYTRDCFLYKLLNKALRAQDIDLLYLFSFFIRDLHEQLKQNQCQSLLRLYRGQIMSKKEVQQLKNFMGQLISMNSFVSTTADREVAAIFSGADAIPSNNDTQSVLFEIEADPNITDIKPFADITPFSYMQDEEEVLMMLGSIFRLVHMRYEGQLCVIQLVLCSENGHDIKPIFDQMKYHSKGSTNAGIYGIVLANMGKYVEAEKYIQCELQESSSSSHDDQTKKFNLSVSYKNYGAVASSKGEYSKSLEWFQKALDIRLQIVKPDHPSIADIYHDIGNVYCDKCDYNQAITAYNTALTINRRALGDNHPNVASNLSTIGSIYAKERQYSEALQYMHEALTIRQKHFTANHRLLGDSHTNLATVYRSLHNFDLALEHYHTALKIYEKSLPSHHSDLARLYNGIGTVYSDKRNFQQALLYFEKAAAIFRETLPYNHPDVICVQQNIDGMRNNIRIVK